MGIRMKLLICQQCGYTAPRHYMVGALCYSCHLDGYIPAGYQQKEKYRRDGVWVHSNATRRPPLGVPFLDEARDRIRQIVLLTVRTRQIRWWYKPWARPARRADPSGGGRSSTSPGPT